MPSCKRKALDISAKLSPAVGVLAFPPSPPRPWVTLLSGETEAQGGSSFSRGVGMTTATEGNQVVALVFVEDSLGGSRLKQQLE